MEKNLILTKAKGAVLSHDFATAARLYKMLLAEDASNVEYLKQLGSIYVQNQEDEKAIPYYEQIITFYPHYIEAMNSLGAIYRRLGRYEESINILQRAVDEGRDAASVNYNLGFTYKEMGNFKDAIDAFNLVVHENPDDVLAYNHLGRIYFAQQNYDKAIASYKRGLQIDQNHPILNYNLAHCYEATKNTPDAVRCYQAALKTRPGWVDAISDFSELLIKSQKNKEAQDLVQQSIKLHPTNADLLCLLGRVYLNQYDYSAAEKTFKKADSYRLNDVKILTGLSEALEKGEKVEAALDTVLSALEIEPENKDIRKQYVHTLLTAKDYDTALENVQDLYEKTEGKDLSVLDLYGQYYICKDQEEQAQQYYNKIKQQNHHYKDYMINAADRFSQIGKHDKAESYANQFIERRPSNPEGYNILGKIYENKGDLKKAIDSYNKSLNLRKPNALADKKIAAFTDELVKQATAIDEPVVQEIPAEPAPVVTEAPVVEAPEEKQEEEFDYSLMGGNVPLQEGLVEEEKDFFDTLDEDNENLPEEEEKPDEKTDEDKAPEFKYNSGAPSDVFGDDGIFDDDAAKKANNTLENGLKDATDEVNNAPDSDQIPADNGSTGAETGTPSEDDSLADSLADNADEDDGFNIFDNDPLPQEEDSSAGQTPSSSNAPAPAQREPAPAPEQAAPASPKEDYAPVQQSAAPERPYYPQQDELEKRMQQIAMDNAAHAMEAAFAAQKMAQQLADQQKIMQEQTQQALQEAMDKVQNLQEERMKEQDRKLDSLLEDDNILDETPVTEEPVFESSDEIPVEETLLSDEDFVEEVSENPEVESVEEVESEVEETENPEDDFDLDLGEDSSESVEEIADNIFEESDEPEVNLFTVDDILEDTGDDVVEEPEFTEEENSIPEDDFELDLGESPAEETAAEEVDLASDGEVDSELMNEESEYQEDSVSEYEEEILEEELKLEGDEELQEDTFEDADNVFVEEIMFLTVEELLLQLEGYGEASEEEFDDSDFDTEAAPVVIEEIIEEEPAFDEEPVFEVNQYEQQSEFPAESEPAMTADDMLTKIERILSDDDVAKEYGPQLELFKKLKVLSEYLPDSEKNTFLSCRMRMLIEYIISKMSGKPGLLTTATALLKSGILGEEYDENLEEDPESDGEVRNELIRAVLMDMKKLTKQLPDRTLADAMVASVDNILERIEIEDQKSKIF